MADNWELRAQRFGLQAGLCHCGVTLSRSCSVSKVLFPICEMGLGESHWVSHTASVGSLLPPELSGLAIALQFPLEFKVP